MKFAIRSFDLKKRIAPKKGLVKGIKFKEIFKLSRKWGKKSSKNILKGINRKTNKNMLKGFKKLFK